VEIAFELVEVNEHLGCFGMLIFWKKVGSEIP
jgi:hypothetical protein